MGSDRQDALGLPRHKSLRRWPPYGAGVQTAVPNVFLKQGRMWTVAFAGKVSHERDPRVLEWAN